MQCCCCITVAYGGQKQQLKMARCSRKQKRAVAGNKSALSFQRENDFFRNVLSMFKSLLPHGDHAVKELTQTRRFIHKMREKSEKSRGKMIDALV